jgi:hypothetical protein
MFQSPHFIASLGLILLSLLFFLWAQKYQLTKYAVLAGMSSLILFEFHPFHVPTLYLIAGIFSLILFIREKANRKKIAVNLIIYYLISAPSILYYAWQMLNPIIRQMNAQNICQTTPIWSTLISYGIYLPLAIIAIYILWKKKIIPESKEWLFLSIWAIIQFILIYSPFIWQRRLTEGLQIPLVLLSVWTIFYYLDKRNYWPRTSTTLILMIMIMLPLSLSNLFVYSSAINKNLTHTWPIYLSKDVYQALNWLKNNTDQKKDTILATKNLSYFVPGISGRFTLYSHGVATTDYGQKISEANIFFSGAMGLDNSSKWLRQNNITYIIISKDYKIANNIFGDLGLKKVFDNTQATIYQVNYSLSQ